MDDWELLQQYVKEQSRQAMDALIRRHLAMVYNVALRELHDPHLAEDVTQAVFLVLLRRAHTLAPSVVLAGWLFKVARYAVADARKQQLRRQHHEREAARMKPATGLEDSEGAWQQVLPLLNDAVGSLSPKDRDAVVLKYLEGKSHGEMAEALRTTENAARQRLFRSVGKLRSFFKRRGITMTESMLGAALIHAAVEDAPAALADRVSAILESEASATSLSIAEGALRMMRISRLRIAGVVCVSVLVVISTVGALAYAAVSSGGAKAGGSAQRSATPASQPAESTPRRAVVACYRAALAGDEKKFIDFFDSPKPDEETKLRQVVRVMAALETLRQAVIAKFGEDAANRLGISVLGVKELDLLDAKETITDDRAIVDLGQAGPGQIHLVKVNGEWKVSSSMDMPANIGGMEQAVPLLREFAANVKSGKYKTVEELDAAMAAAQRR